MIDYQTTVSLKYCGSCNPLTSLSQIGNELRKAISKEDGLSPVSPENCNVAIMVILCGCPRACGNTEEIRARASRCIVVAGETVDMAPVAEKDIGAAVLKKLKPQ